MGAGSASTPPRRTDRVPRLPGRGLLRRGHGRSHRGPRRHRGDRPARRPLPVRRVRPDRAGGHGGAAGARRLAVGLLGLVTRGHPGDHRRRPDAALRAGPGRRGARPGAFGRPPPGRARHRARARRGRRHRLRRPHAARRVLRRAGTDREPAGRVPPHLLERPRPHGRPHDRRRPALRELAGTPPAPPGRSGRRPDRRRAPRPDVLARLDRRGRARRDRLSRADPQPPRARRRPGHRADRRCGGDRRLRRPPRSPSGHRAP